MPEPLPQEFDAPLRASAGRRGQFGHRIVYVPETTSTNDLAASLADRGASEGTMVLASSQTVGRGRLGRSWFSPPGAGLYASVVCRRPATAPFITLAGGVAVAEGIRGATGLPVLIKWPNDIVVEDRVAPTRRRKLSGILAEGASGSDGLQYVVLGFGVNLRAAAYPADIAARATSLETELGRPVDGGSVLAEILASLNAQIAELSCGNTAAVLRRWQALASSVVGASIQWSANGEQIRGVTAGIDERGALLVRVGNRVERVIAGEITWL